MSIVRQERRITLQPQSFDELERFADRAAKSTLVPKDFIGRPDNIIIAVQWGQEIGLGPLQAMQNISVINGRPAIWGDAMLALVRGSGICAYVRETIEGDGDAVVALCRCRRRDDESETIGRFSVSDAKKAGLWTKPGPWTQYPQRMLQLRARGFALRDAFPDVLRGVVSAEEARDAPSDDTFRGTTIEGGTIIAQPSPPGWENAKGGGNGSMRDFVATSGLGRPAPEPPTELDKRAALFEGGPPTHPAGFVPSKDGVATAWDQDTTTFLHNLKQKLGLCQTEDDVHKLIYFKTVSTALAKAPEPVQREINAMFSERFAEIEKAKALEIEASAAGEP